MNAGCSAGIEQGQGREEMPPLGLLPRWLVAEHRLRDVRRAVDRYTEAGRAVPGEWLAELDDLVAYLDRYPAPSVPPARDSGRDEAREAVARALSRYEDVGTWSAMDELTRSAFRRVADELLSLPAVVALLRDGTMT